MKSETELNRAANNSMAWNWLFNSIFDSMRSMRMGEGVGVQSWLFEIIFILWYSYFHRIMFVTHWSIHHDVKAKWSHNMCLIDVHDAYNMSDLVAYHHHFLYPAIYTPHGKRQISFTQLYWRGDQFPKSILKWFGTAASTDRTDP